MEPVLGRLWVELNSRLEGLQSELEDGGNLRARCELQADVARHVVEAALDDAEGMRSWIDANPDPLPDVPRGEQSLAALALQYLDGVYPDRSDVISTALEERIGDRALFEARFQSHFWEARS